MRVSLPDMDKAFNKSIQADYAIVYIRNERYEVLSIEDMGIQYEERAISNCKSAENMLKMIERLFINVHGTPKSFSENPEFCKPFLTRHLSDLRIKINYRPSRSSRRNGVVEPNNGIFKTILSHL